MSLSIGVAPYQQCREDDGSILDDEGWEMVAEDMAAINAALADEGLPAHVEPESVPNLDEVLRVAEAPVSYGDLHLLRVAYARVLAGQPLEPWPPVHAAHLDEAVDAVSSLFVHHLIDHSDAEGYYVPVDFPDVLISADGMPFGSSQQLLAELGRVAPALGMAVDATGRPTAEAFAAASVWLSDEDEAARARRAWAQLSEAAWVSVNLGVAVVFQ